MRIQEMKSGLVHLKKSADEERQNVSYGIAVARALSESREAERSPASVGCELDEPRWAVVSLEKREAAGLTYDEATALTRQLDSKGVAGLCLVADETAARVG
jgi:hypothetical protein